MMNRLTALDQARVLLGPTGYAEYSWRGNGEEPLCVIGTLEGIHLFPKARAATFEEALNRSRPKR